MIDTSNPVSVYLSTIGSKGGRSKSPAKLSAIANNLKLANKQRKADSMPNGKNKSSAKRK